MQAKSTGTKATESTRVGGGGRGTRAVPPPYLQMRKFHVVVSGECAVLRHLGRGQCGTKQPLLLQAASLDQSEQ